MGIRAKLVLAFGLAIVLPVATAFFSLNLIVNRVQRTSEINQVEINEVTSRVTDKVVESWGVIKDYDQFSLKVSPLLNRYQLHLQVFDNEGKPLFDSEKGQSSTDGETAPDNTIVNIIGKIYRFRIPVNVAGKTVGEAVIMAKDPAIAPFTDPLKALVAVFLSLGIGMLTLVALIIGFSLYISHTILRPLRELNTATARISEGDLDFELNYRRDDELGRFTRAFELMRRKLKQSLEEQYTSEQSRKEMIAGISHDLRTPLASIKGYVEGLQDGVAGDRENFERYLEVIKTKTNQLDRLIDDLFQYAKLELGKLDLELRAENSKELLENILTPVETEFKNSSVKFEVVRPLPERIVTVDRIRVGQIIENLIQNARRYTPKGTIQVRAEIMDDLLAVYIKDNGRGIPEADLAHIFKRFYRGEKSRSREYGGTGLGLAICKQLVEAHRGQIRVESTEGYGSTFIFTLPIIRD